MQTDKVHEAEAVAASDAPASSKPASIAQLLGDQNIFRMIATYGAVALIGMAFTALIPLVCAYAKQAQPRL